MINYDTTRWEKSASSTSPNFDVNNCSHFDLNEGGITPHALFVNIIDSNNEECLELVYSKDSSDSQVKKGLDR